MAIFYRTRVFGWRFWILCLFSLLMMLGDHKHILVPKIKPVLGMMVAPLEEAVTMPERGFIYLRDYLTLQHELVHDKQHWQDQKLFMQAQLQQLNALKIQNQELQSLLKTEIVEQNQKYLLAKVVGINSDALTHQIILNRGSNLGVKSGQAVVAATGVVGQVVQVNPLNVADR
jgi:rod shape-determining protein MreC